MSGCSSGTDDDMPGLEWDDDDEDLDADRYKSDDLNASIQEYRVDKKRAIKPLLLLGGAFILAFKTVSILFSLFVTVVRFIFLFINAFYQTLRAIQRFFHKVLYISLVLVIFSCVAFPNAFIGLLSSCYLPVDCAEIYQASVGESHLRILNTLLRWAVTVSRSLAERFIEEYIGSGLFSYRFSLFFDDAFFIIRDSPRIIFDSGATTHLVRVLLHGDEPRTKKDVGLAFGQKAHANISNHGDVQQDDLNEELISMGKFCKAGGHVDWDRECRVSCADFQFSLEVERNCPLLSQEQALQIRHFIRRSEVTDAYACYVNAAAKTDSPSVPYLHRTSRSFDYFFKRGFFDDHLARLADINPPELRNLWERAEGPHDFLNNVDSLVASARGGASSVENENPRKATQPRTDHPSDEATCDGTEPVDVYTDFSFHGMKNL